MSKTIQFRCEECLRKLFTWEIGSKYTSNPFIEKRKIGDNMYVRCDKCQTVNLVTMRGLQSVKDYPRKKEASIKKKGVLCL